MFSVIPDGNDDRVQTLPATETEQNSARSGQTWHQLLLHPSPSSSQLSYCSEMQTDAGSQASTPRQTRVGIFGEQDENATNYDSGNFSFSESAAKERLAPVPECAGGDLHQRFVQLNTELYQAKTELLTYKYKWNEIRNEIELSWSKKLDKLSDEKNVLLSELDDVRKEIARLKATPFDADGLELSRIRSELRDVSVRLECKETANDSLKQKIAEQHVEKENLGLRIRNLEKLGCEEHSVMCRLKASERWFREELHRCQSENAKLKDSYRTLDDMLQQEKTERKLLLKLAQTRKGLVEHDKVFSIVEATDESKQPPKEEEERSTKLLEEEIAILKNVHQHRESILLEKNTFAENQNRQLHAVIVQLRQALHDQQTHAAVLAQKEKEALQEISRLRDDTQVNETRDAIRRYRTEIQTLSAQLAVECFHKRQIDVSVEKLKAQVKVLSINLATRPCQRLAVEECGLTTVRQRNHDLQEQCNRLTSEKQRLEIELAMYSGPSVNPQNDQLLLDNFCTIHTKNLNLELKLGQCVTVDGKDEEVANDPRGDEVLEMVVNAKKDSGVLAKNNKEQQTETSMNKPGERSKSLCPKHGQLCRQIVTKLSPGADEDAEMRKLRVWLKAIENENRRRLQRYEVSNRTLLQKVKEHTLERNEATQRIETLEKEHERCNKLRGEMASARERCLLMEADLATAQQEADILRTEKKRLIFLLENNCLLASDGDVWGSLKRVFKELRDLQHVHKENSYLQRQIEANAHEIERLQASVGNWKLANDVLVSDADELRSELMVKTLQLEDFQRTIDRVVGENASLQHSVSIAGDNGKALTERLAELNRLVQIQEIRLETAHERLKLYEESDRILEASKGTFFHDLQSLQDAILIEKREKCELEEEVRELRQNMVNAVGNSLQNFHPTGSSNGGSGHHSATTISQESAPLALSPANLDINHLRALVEESSRKRYSLQPLHECVSSLKLEMDHLNSVLQLGDYPAQQPAQQQLPQPPRFPLSLMDELNDATNGHYGSR